MQSIPPDSVRTIVATEVAATCSGMGLNPNWLRVEVSVVDGAMRVSVTDRACGLGVLYSRDFPASEIHPAFAARQSEALHLAILSACDPELVKRDDHEQDVQ
jgi:hypothetical protein